MAYPSNYDPSFTDQAIEFLSQGYSLMALAGHFGVTRKTIYNWKESHPDFAEAVEIGQAKGLLSWEQDYRTFAKTGDGNATAYVFALKNRAPDEWRDMKALEHSGPDGDPIETVGRIVWQQPE